MTERQRRIPEQHVDGRRLGRHVAHDERSKAFRVDQQTPIQSRLHHRNVRPYDQGHLGSCTAQATFGILSTAPFSHHYRSQHRLQAFYAATTAADPFPGAWPPDDTGSDENSAMKVARDWGLIGGWTHAFGVGDAARLIQTTAIAVGVDWLDTYDDKSVSGGTITLGDVNAGQVRGGHEFEVAGLQLDAAGGAVTAGSLWLAWQSWGTDLPPFHIAGDALAVMLANQGDVCAPNLGSPA